MGAILGFGLAAGLMSPASAEQVEKPAPAEAAEAPASTETEALTAPDEISASVLARLKGREVEDLSQRTEDSQTFALPDGEWRSDIWTGPEWVPTGEDPTTGEGWAKLDTGIVEDGDGFRPAAHPGHLEFSGAAEGRNLVVSGQNANGDPFELYWTGVLPEPIVEADAIRYPEIEAGIDLVFFVTATGYEQFFVAKDAAALGRVDELELQFESPEGGLREDGSGLAVVSDDESVVAQAGSVEVWDAVEDQARVNPVATMAPAPDTEQPVVESPSNASIPPQTTEIDSDVTVQGDVGTVVIDPADVPVDDDTVFPVIIDPSVNLSLSFDTMVTNESVDDKSTNVELRVGTYNSGTAKYRSYLNVNVSPILGKKVTKATFSIYNFHSWNCTARAWEVWSTSATSSSTRWSNMPTMYDKFASTTATSSDSSSCAAKYLTQDITSLVDAWSQSTSTTRGMGLKAASETDNLSWKRFYSGNNSTNKPKLSVTYNSYPNKPSSVKMNGIWPPQNSTHYINDTTPTFTSPVSDPDGGNVKGLFTITSGTSTIVSKASGSTVASGGTSSYTRTLDPGKAYRVEMWANDGSLTSKTSNVPTWSIYVDTTPPDPTALTVPGFTHGQWKSTAPSSISASLSATDAVSFEYKVDSGTTQTIAASSGAATVTGLPRTNGGHTIIARAIDRAGNASAWTDTFEYGIGSVAISAPFDGFKTTDEVKITASAPAASAGTVARALYWRESGTSNGADYSPTSGGKDGWKKIRDLTTVAAGTNPSVSESWTVSQVTTLASKLRTPLALDVQVCFTYSTTNDTLCTWQDGAPTQRSIIRVPHAFGDNFPVTDAGPGQVALWTGEFNTSETDVEVPGYTGTLSISRSYNTYAADGDDTAFGPGWKPSFEGSDVGAAGLSVIDSTGFDGMIALEDGEGSYLLYKQPGGTKTAQKVGTYLPIDQDTAALGWVLTLTGSGTAARLTLIDDAGVKTVWAPGATAGTWRTESIIEPGSAGQTSFAYDSAGRVKEIIAPIPDGLTSDCTTSSFAAGCRALYLTYSAAGDTTDGAYPGRLRKVQFRAWDPTAAAVTLQDVVTYRYTAEGVLASVTDNRSNLATAYTYSGTTQSGLPALASLTPPGQAAWKLVYTSGKLTGVNRAAPVSGGSDVSMNTFVYDLNTTAMPSGTPNVRSQVSAWSQDRVPTKGFAVFGTGEKPSSTPTSDQWRNAELYFTDDDGYTVNTAEYGAGAWLLTADEFDEHGNIVRTFDAPATSALLEEYAETGEPVAAGTVNSMATITRYNKTIKASAAVTWDGGTIATGSVLVPAGTLVTDTWSPAETLGDGTMARLHIHTDYDQGAPNSGVNPRTGQKFSLPTRNLETRAAAESGSWDPNVTVATGEPVLADSTIGYAPIDSAGTTSETSGWILGLSTIETTVMGTGTDIVTKTRYDALGRVVETRKPGSTGTDAATQLTSYYSVSGTGPSGCVGTQYAKWAGLACRVSTGETTPTLPIRTVTGYSRLLAPTTVTETQGSTVRTTSTGYLADGRSASSTVSVSGLTGSTPVKRTDYEYDSSSGLLQATVAKNGATETGRVVTTTDRWGRPTSYTDTDGIPTTRSYNSKGQLASVNDTKRTVTYGYDTSTERRGFVTSTQIPGAGAFSATYDAGGNIASQTMPGNVTQGASYSVTGNQLALSYSAVDADGETVPLLAWSQEYDLFARVIAETTPTGGYDPEAVSPYARAFTYDRAGRLVKVEDRTAGVGDVVAEPGADAEITPCVTRSYAFDVRGNRLSRSTATSAADGACTTGGGFTDAWSYTSQDRVQYGANSTGSYAYDALGRQTTVPAIDTPGGAAAGNLQVSYHHNDLVRSLSQDGATTTFDLDPLMRRSLSTLVTATGTTSVTRHYSDETDNPGWVTEQTGTGPTVTTWYGSGVGGDLGVTLEAGSTGTKAQVQLAGPRDSVSIPIEVDTTANTVVNVGGFTDYDEYGRPLAGTGVLDTGGVSYGWLGAKERATDDATGLILMGVRPYNPTTGLFLSVDPVDGGNTTAYTYPQDPINKTDLSGLISEDNIRYQIANHSSAIRKRVAEMRVNSQRLPLRGPMSVESHLNSITQRQNALRKALRQADARGIHVSAYNRASATMKPQLPAAYASKYRVWRNSAGQLRLAPRIAGSPGFGVRFGGGGRYYKNKN